MGRAAGLPPLGWDCCRASQTAVFDAQMTKKKNKEILYSSQLEPKKESVGVFKIILLQGQMHFTYPKCSDLFL